LRSYDCRDLGENFSAELFCSQGKAATLTVGESHSSVADLLPQNAIFLNQVIDDLVLPLVHPTGNRNDQK